MTYSPASALACVALFVALPAHAHAQAPVRPAKAGDVHVYATQQKTEKTSFDETVTITAVEGDRIKTSHVRTDKPTPTEGLYGMDWSTYKSGSSGMQMNPPSRVLSLPLAIGKTWGATYEGLAATGGKLRIKIDSKVAAEERLKTPGGEFQAFRIESEGYVNGISFPGGWAIRQVVWYAPAIDRVVRIEFKELRTMGADNVSELKQFKPAD